MYSADPSEGECEDGKVFLSWGGLPLSSQNLKASAEAGHPVAAVIHFLSLLQVYCCSPLHLAQLSLRVLLGGEGRTHPWRVSRPFLSLPSFVFAVQTAFCYPCQWSFQKQESCFLWPLGARTVYLMSGTSNKFLCSRCRNNPRQKKTMAMRRIRKRWGWEITGGVEEEAVSPTLFTGEK